MMRESPQVKQYLCWSRRGVKISTDQMIHLLATSPIKSYSRTRWRQYRCARPIGVIRHLREVSSGPS